MKPALQAALEELDTRQEVVDYIAELNKIIGELKQRILQIENRPTMLVINTRTYTVLEVSPETFKEVWQKLYAVGYLHCIDDERELIILGTIALKEATPTNNGDPV